MDPKLLALCRRAGMARYARTIEQLFMDYMDAEPSTPSVELQSTVSDSGKAAKAGTDVGGSKAAPKDRPRRV